MSFPASGPDDFDAILQTYRQNKAQLLKRIFSADLETPVSTWLKLSQAQNYSFLLESIEGGQNKSRYSFIGIDPDLIWRCRDGRAETAHIALSPKKPSNKPTFIASDDPPIVNFRHLWLASQIESSHDFPPMAAGLFGYMGYDMVRQIEHIGTPPPDALDLEDAIFIRPRLVAVFDHVRDTLTFLCPLWPPESDENPSTEEAKKAIENAMALLDKAEKLLEAPLPLLKQAVKASAQQSVRSNLTQSDYEGMVHKAKDYIHEGDIFQIVLSQRFAISCADEPAFNFYRRLRRLNPSPYLFFLQFDDLVVTGSSPEILVSVREGIVSIRPIAGTRPRGKNEAEDKKLEAELLADEKECAEHLMLLDLARNDAGRVAEKGSVRVVEQFVIERYSHVMHIASEVNARLAKGKDALDALFSGFPAGTLSGAPKIHAMELIDELEPEKRGIYGGCIGYFGANGDVDSCIALRMAVIKQGVAYIQAGAGIVADSVPEAEYQECVSKAGALIEAGRPDGVI